MIKYKTTERKVDLYDIGDGLTLMNVILKTWRLQDSAADSDP